MERKEVRCWEAKPTKLRQLFMTEIDPVGGCLKD